MNQNQNKIQQTLSFPEVIIYRSQRAIYVPQDENNDGVFTNCIRINFDDIICIQSHRDGYAYIRTTNGDIIRTTCQLCDILEKLDEYDFAQTSYDTIVNLTMVDIVYARALSIRGVVYEVVQQFISNVMDTFNARKIDKNTDPQSPFPYDEDYYVHADKCARRVRPSEIIRIEVGGNFTTIHSKGERKSLTVGIPLKVWEKVLPANHFAKVTGTGSVDSLTYLARESRHTAAAWFPLFAMPFHARVRAKNNKKIQRLAQALACFEKSHYLCTEKSVGIPTKVLV